MYSRLMTIQQLREVAEGVEGPSLKQVERLAESAAGMGPLLWVSFGGGEPFLREDLAGAGEYGRRRVGATLTVGVHQDGGLGGRCAHRFERADAARPSFPADR